MTALIPPELAKAVEQARAKFAYHEDRQLDWSDRLPIWRALGPPGDPEQAILSPGWRRRASLALACAETVMPFWTAREPREPAQHLLRLATCYQRGEAGQYELWRAFDNFHAALEGMSGHPAILAGQTIAQAAGVALFDEPLADETPHTLDPAGGAAECHATLGADPAQAVSERSAFWNWYLRTAVKDAWNSL